MRAARRRAIVSGMKLGPYEVLGELGRGGMGVVLRARAPDGTVVAVKCLHSVKQEAVARFEREERLLATLGEAAGFVPIIDAGETPRGPYLVMPLVGGGTLRNRLRNGPLAVADAVALGRTLAIAAGKAHALGIIHRDLKPENVLYTTGGVPLVADLGLAKHWNRAAPGASQSLSLSVSGEAKGTAGYMAPEALDDSRLLGPAADVFALGAILYECLAGEPAFQGDTIPELFARVASGTFTPLRSVRRDVPPWLDAVVSRALEPKPANRFADGAELAAALEEPASAPSRRSPAIAVGSLVAVIALIVAVALASRRRETVPGPSPGTSVVTNEARPAPASALKLLAAWGPDEETASKAIVGLAIFPDDARAATVCESDQPVIWDAATGRVRARLKPVVPLRPYGLTIVDGRPVTPHEGPNVCVWDLELGTLIHTFGVSTTPRVNSVAVIPGTSRFMIAPEDGIVRLNQAIPPRDLAHTIIVHEGGTRAVTASADGKHALTGGAAGDVRLWDVTGDGLAQVARVGSLATPVTSLALDRECRRALAGGQDGTLVLWELPDASFTLQAMHEGAVVALALVPGHEDLLLSASRDGTVRLWDLGRRRELDRLSLGSELPTALAVFSDGKSFLVGTSSGRVLRHSIPPRG